MAVAKSTAMHFPSLFIICFFSDGINNEGVDGLKNINIGGWVSLRMGQGGSGWVWVETCGGEWSSPQRLGLWLI